MNLLFDSFWRALTYGLKPRVILLSFLPLLLMTGLALGVGNFYWDSLLASVRLWLESSTLMGSMTGWMQSFGMGDLKAVLAPLIVIFAVTPLIVVLSLMVVSLLMTPALTSLVAKNRFPSLERKRGGSLLASLWWSLVSTLLALVALVVSVPLWLIPPLILILPPLIWGWLTYRVMAFDALAEHANTEERREIFRRHRISLLGIGLFCGYLGAAPSLIWASGALLVAAFVVLVPLAIWLYTMVFAFASLWFAHFCLAALHLLREERARAAAAPTPPDVLNLDSPTLPLSDASKYLKPPPPQP
ncbi:EI24 domain-containing protein [Rhodoferax sp.]|uniref:EI24 domain-containing protein n=1 Tax=Rhodoferax sp. TaxID=50421 RepID=UPI003BB4F42A|nr:EI24 domain-containing protein [Rhodoferax sp.]